MNLIKGSGDYFSLLYDVINNETTKISDLYFEKDCILSGF